MPLEVVECSKDVFLLACIYREVLIGAKHKKRILYIKSSVIFQQKSCEKKYLLAHCCSNMNCKAIKLLFLAPVLHGKITKGNDGI
jgi:hypothetical protein